jgi:outer membrane protein OmpA-like peptidoglycan-associated protein
MNKLNLMIKASSFYLLAFSFCANAQDFTSIKNVNSPYDEQNPYLTPQGELFFTRGFHPSNKGGNKDFGDIWLSTPNASQQLSKPIHLPEMSTTALDVVIGFTDHLTLLVYHGGDQEKTQGIHQYKRFGSSWNYFRPLQIDNFLNKSHLFSATINDKGDVMILSMEGNPTFGNEDIYVSFKISEEEWSTPQNLGTDINSERQELTPYYCGDSNLLVFSSNAAKGNQGMDIFMAKKSKDSWQSWSSPKAIFEINSPASETSFFALNNNGALFSSTKNSEGFGDFVFQKEVSAITDLPFDQKSIKYSSQKTIDEEHISPTFTEKAVSVPNEGVVKQDIIELVVLNKNDNQAIPFEIFFIHENETSRAPLQQRQYIKSEWEGFSFESVMIRSKGFVPQYFNKEEWSQLNTHVFYLDPILAGKKLVLENIQFRQGTSDLAENQSLEVLDELVSYLSENPLVQIRIEGHSDNVGDPSLNKELSIQRANSIRVKIQEKGISFERIKIAGWGGTRPVQSNETEQGRIKNRRVEIHLEQK